MDENKVSQELSTSADDAAAGRDLDNRVGVPVDYGTLRLPSILKFRDWHMDILSSNFGRGNQRSSHGSFD